MLKVDAIVLMPHQTAVYLNCPRKYIVYSKDKKNISILVGGTVLMRFTLCVSVAMHGTKLLLFVVFKGKHNGILRRIFLTYFMMVNFDANRVRLGLTNV